jgi:hypothetical protein
MSLSRQWALDLWDAGYQVVVAPLRGKRPSIPWKKFQSERVPRELVEEWFQEGEHNLALISGTISGTVVVDGDSAEACAHIEATCTPTMKVLTCKGAHYYYGHPGGKVPNAVRVTDEPPIDLRGDGGLTIGPGSLHASGIYYRLPDDGDLVSTRDLPPFDRTWFPLEEAKEQAFIRPILQFPTMAQKDAYEQAARYMAKVPGSPQGQRDNDCYIQACRLVRGFNLTDDEALDLLRVWNLSCTPPLDDAEVAGKVKHARAYGTGEFGGMLARRPTIVGGLMIYGWL